jgi:hypothetical protein
MLSNVFKVMNHLNKSEKSILQDIKKDKQEDIGEQITINEVF